jgi:hypothetical protein
MDPIHARLDTLKQRTHTVERHLRWWRGLACSLIGLAVLTWALPLGTADTQHQNTLEKRVAALEHALRSVSSASDAEGRAELVIRRNLRVVGNLHLVNGLGRTDCTDEQGHPIPDCPNGLGNLMVGYNESRNDPVDPDVRTGSHNVVVGRRHNFARFGGLVVGDYHTITGAFASVSGGIKNPRFHRITWWRMPALNESLPR